MKFEDAKTNQKWCMTGGGIVFSSPEHWERQKKGERTIILTPLEQLLDTPEPSPGMILFSIPETNQETE